MNHAVRRARANGDIREMHGEIREMHGEIREIHGEIREMQITASPFETVRCR